MAHKVVTPLADPCRVEYKESRAGRVTRADVASRSFDAATWNKLVDDAWEHATSQLVPMMPFRRTVVFWSFQCHTSAGKAHDALLKCMLRIDRKTGDCVGTDFQLLVVGIVMNKHGAWHDKSLRILPALPNKAVHTGLRKALEAHGLDVID